MREKTRESRSLTRREFAAMAAIAVPGVSALRSMHPGAARYYREKGVLK